MDIVKQEEEQGGSALGGVQFHNIGHYVSRHSSPLALKKILSTDPPAGVRILAVFDVSGDRSLSGTLSAFSINENRIASYQKAPLDRGSLGSLS